MAWVNELIGFIIVLFALLFPLIQKLLLKKSQKKKPLEPVVKEEKKKRRAEGQPPVRHTAQRVVVPEYAFHPSLEERSLDSSIEKRVLPTHIEPHFKQSVVSSAFMVSAIRQLETTRPNPLIHVLLKKHPLQSMVIASEVFGLPKGLDDSTR